MYSSDMPRPSASASPGTSATANRSIQRRRGESGASPENTAPSRNTSAMNPATNAMAPGENDGMPLLQREHVGDVVGQLLVGHLELRHLGVGHHRLGIANVLRQPLRVPLGTDAVELPALVRHLAAIAGDAVADLALLLVEPLSLVGARVGSARGDNQRR